jgi:hypothetical protein
VPIVTVLASMSVGDADRCQFIFSHMENELTPVFFREEN